jgi:ABC-type dipeptide/oligopeptide/nickel transport system ATPase component
MVLQSPVAALNPALRIGAQMAEAWRAHDKKNARGWRDRALESCERVALPNAAELLERYPRQLSVGQAQRILIAMAILHRPRLLIADEPTSALDAITSAEILALFKNLRRELNMAMLFISHDLLSVSSLCDRLVILRRGEIVETGATAQIFQHPSHEYTRALVNAVPPHPLMMPDSGLIALSRFTQQQPPDRALPAGDVLTTAETAIGRR